MNGALGQLGAFYGLSPATLGALGAKAGMPDPSAPSAPPVDDSMSGAIDISGMTPGQITSAVSQANGGMPVAGPTNFGNAPPQAAAPEAPPAPEAQAPQGPPPGYEQAPQVQPLITTPAHWAPTTHETERSGGMSPENARAYGAYRTQAVTEREKAAQAELEDAHIKGLADGAYRAAEAYQMGEAADRRRAIEEQRQRYIQQNVKDTEEAVAQASLKIEPDMWKGNTLGRVLAAISIGLGQAGAMMTHTENGALKIIDGAEREFVDAQKANIANARGRVNDLRAQKADRLAGFDDDVKRDAGLRILYLDQVKRETDAWAAKNGLSGSMQYHNILAGLADRRAEAIKDIATNADGKFTEKMSERYYQAQTTGGQAPAKREGNLVSTADGTTYHFSSDKLAEEATKRIQGYQDAQLLTNEILRLRKETMKLDPLVDKRKYDANTLTLQDLDDKLAVADSMANGQGTVTAADTERRKKVGLEATAGLGAFKGIGNILGTDYDSANSAYERGLKVTTDRMRNWVTAAGGEVYRRDYARDANGNLVPTGSFTGQDAKPAQRIAPHGARPMDNRQHIETDSAPDRETTPYAPLRSGVAKPAPGGKR